MQEKEYKEAIWKAMMMCNLHRMTSTEDFTNVAMRLPANVVKAVAEEQVFEDRSTLMNNPNNGKKIEFYPSWVKACENELQDRILFGEIK